MSWKGAGIGAAIGAIFGGPVGAGIGAAIGHLVSGSGDDSIKVLCPHCNTKCMINKEVIIWECNNCHKVFIATENFKSENDYLTYLYFTIFGLIAKIAKIDGVVSKSEAKTITKILDSFCENKEERDIAKSFYNEAKNDDKDLAYYAQLFYSLSYDKEDLRHMVYAALFEVASADGGLEERERDALLELLSLLNLSRSIYDNLYDELVGNVMSLKKAYEILGCDENASNEEIKRAYRNKVKEFHPDRIMAKNLPEAFIKFANDQMKLITEAYETIKKVRNL